MSNETPKLYVHKPKKAQLKKHLQQQSRSSPSPSPSPSPTPVTASSSSSMASQSTASSSSRVPPTPPKKSLARRYKFLWPLLLAVNFSVGAYLFMRTKKKESIEEDVTAAATSTPTSAVSTAAVSDTPTSLPVVMEPPKVREPIPLDQQRELFKWILEEKRKIKPKDPEEKKKVDEEKAILKQFIRAKSIPPI